MKRCYSLLLTIYLTFGVGIYLFAQVDPDRFVMEVQQNIIAPQDTVRIQNGGEFQNTEKSQHTPRTQNRQEPQNWEELQDKTKIKLTGNQLIIEDLPEDGVLEIYNIMGVKVYNRRVKAGTNQYILSLPKGYYIIKIGKLTRKIAIK